MGRKILVAIDESDNSLKAAKYAADTFQKDSMVTLLSIMPIIPAPCDLESPTLTPLFKENIQAFCAMEEAKRDVLEAVLEKGKKVFLNAGFPVENITVKLRKMEVGIARDIARETEQGHYDTLVIGRRGLTGIKQYVFGSISNKLFHLVKDVAVVIVE